MYFKVSKEADLKGAAYDGVIYICTPNIPTDGVCPLAQAVHVASKYDSTITKKGARILPMQDVPAGRLVVASTGKIDPDYDDVREFRDAAAKGVKQALAAGIKRPLLYLQEYPGYPDSDLVTLLGVYEALHVVSAHVSAFMANHLHPYKVPRITGLDPALPGFATVDNLAKLDASDAEFVDVIHTNAFVQGKVEQCGHVDFYCNGGIVQPGCWADDRFFACNHHRAPFYFAESINSPVGFYGWSCSSFLAYIFGRCPPSDPQSLMGEYVDITIKGMQLVITDSVPPFAVGKFQGPTIDILFRQHEMNRIEDFERYKGELEQCNENDIAEALAQPVYYVEEFEQVFY